MLFRSWTPAQVSVLVTLPWAGTDASNLDWSQIHVTWPALFRPTAMNLGQLRSWFGPGCVVFVAEVPKGQKLGVTCYCRLDCRLSADVLHMAAGPLLRSFSTGGGSWEPLGTPILLPHHARGFGVWADAYVVLGAEGLYLLQDTLAPDQSSPGSLDALGLLDLPSSVNGTYLAYPSRVQPATAGTVAAAASITGSSSVAAVVLVASDEIYLCRMSNQTGSFSLGFVSSLKPVGEALSQITGLYMCPVNVCASQAVLWISMSQGRLAAVGFATGKAPVQQIHGNDGFGE